jgi:hypothetical protein
MQITLKIARNQTSQAVGERGCDENFVARRAHGLMVATEVFACLRRNFAAQLLHLLLANQLRAKSSRHTTKLQLFDHAKASRIVRLIRHRDMRRQPLRFKPRFQLAVQHDDGFAAGLFGYLAVPPRHGHAHA